MTFREKLQQELPTFVNENGGEDAMVARIHMDMR